MVPECLNNSWWCFSSSFSTFEDRRRIFPPNPYPYFQRCVVQAWCHALIIVFYCENALHPSGAIQESFQIDSPEPIFSELFIPTFSSRSPNLTGASFKYPLISSWPLRSHVSKFPQVSSFVFQFFSVICAIGTSIFNSYGGSFKSSLPWLSFILSLFQSHRWFHLYLLKFALYLS